MFDLTVGLDYFSKKKTGCHNDKHDEKKETIKLPYDNPL